MANLWCSIVLSSLLLLLISSVAAAYSIFAVGGNEEGQLGLGDRDNRRYPEEVSTLSNMGDNISEVSAGASFSMASSQNGSVWLWGSNSFNQLGVPASQRYYVASPLLLSALSQKRVVKICAGGYHAFALTSDGELYGWGRNSEGQLCLGHNNAVASPEKIALLDSTSTIVGMHAGRLHSLFIVRSSNGLQQLYVCGDNAYGQLGLKNVNQSSTPLLVSVFQHDNITTATCGSYHTMAVANGTKLFSWGNNDAGQLGINSQEPNFTIPHPVQCGVAHHWIESIAAGDQHSLAQTLRGLYAWGSNEYGQLGTNAKSKVSINYPIPLANWEKQGETVKVMAGSDHSLAIVENRSLYSWGWNGQAQLGLLDLENRIKPVETGTVYFKWTVHSVAAGDCHTIVLGHSEKTSNTSGSSSEAPKAPTQVAGIVLVLLVGGVMFAAIGFYIRKTTIQRLRQVQLQRNQFDFSNTTLVSRDDGIENNSPTTSSYLKSRN